MTPQKLRGRGGHRDTIMSTHSKPSVLGTGRIATFVLPGIVAALLLAGCGSFQPGTISPLAGTWYGASRNPGNTFTGQIVFSYTGHLDSLDLTSPQQDLWLVFDGQPNLDDNDDTYTATAHTTLTDDTFLVKGRVEYTEGKHEGLTYITVEGTVHAGEMSGTLTVAFPGNDSVVVYFDAARS